MLNLKKAGLFPAAAHMNMQYNLQFKQLCHIPCYTITSFFLLYKQMQENGMACDVKIKRNQGSEMSLL